MDSMQYDKQIQEVAAMLSDGDGFMKEQIRSVMHVALLDIIRKDRSDAYLLYVAINAALNFVKDIKAW